ncbi:RNA polymerase-binding transcription factor DksA [bacterium HR21]|jgi:RNA polymerase-binding transcription factor DksA|nr:RNA polymerase-binding transcription factor DksA [bacterium HR21]
MATKKRQGAKATKAQAQPAARAQTPTKEQARSSRAKAPQTQSAQPAASQPVGSAPSTPKVRYSDEELEMFRQIVLKEKQKTLEELRLLRERLEDLNSFNYIEEGGIFALHPAEQGAEAWERERTYAQIQRLTAYLQKLDEALKRIDNKTYGICRKCGILIAKERLMAVPITTLSASWKIHHRCPEDGVDRIIPLHAAKALQE